MDAYKKLTFWKRIRTDDKKQTFKQDYVLLVPEMAKNIPLSLWICLIKSRGLSSIVIATGTSISEKLLRQNGV